MKKVIVNKNRAFYFIDTEETLLTCKDEILSESIVGVDTEFYQNESENTLCLI